MTVTLTDDKILISDDVVVTADVVSQAITKHKTLVAGYKENIDYYKGNHKIKTKKAKAEFKPDYRLMVNFTKYIVDTYTAYFIGIPIKVTHETDEVNEFIRIFRENNDLEDNEYELAKIMAIYGRAYEFLSQDEEANTIVTYATPMNTLQYRFTRNTPRNISDEAQTAKMLEGVVPKETQLSVLSIVDNPHDTAMEMEKQVPDVLPDFQKEE